MNLNEETLTAEQSWVGTSYLDVIWYDTQGSLVFVQILSQDIFNVNESFLLRIIGKVGLDLTQFDSWKDILYKKTTYSTNSWYIYSLLYKQLYT